MKSCLVFISLILLSASHQLKAQESISDSKDSVYIPTAKWPYFGISIPPFLGLTIGFEGFKTNSLSIGIAHNISHVGTSGFDDIYGVMVGYIILYKRNLNESKNYSIETDFGIFSPISFGLNINYNQFRSTSVVGFKPFIGISFFHVHLLYGYNFFKTSNELDKIIRHNRFTFRLCVPLFKLSKQKGHWSHIIEYE